MARYSLFVAGLLVFLVLSGVLSLAPSAGQIRDTKSAPPAPEDPAAWTWPVSSPEEQGLDPARLGQLVELIREGVRYPRLHCLLIIRHGYLVLEEYFDGWQAEKLHTLQSVSKSYTSALVGIAIAKGEFKGVDEKVLDFFQGKNDIANLDERKAALRVKDLLTMRSGTDYHESGPDSPHFELNKLETGWDKFYLDRPMLRAPGTHFLYDSGGVILLSSMLKNRTGKHADAYAEESLFKSLKIDSYFWFKNRESHPHTGGGLNLRARDTAKLGQLYLQKGRWGKEQVVPREWVRDSLRPQVDFEAKAQGVIGYGYLWWILSPDPAGAGRQSIAAAMGFKAQYIFVVPEHDMVVVVNGDTRSRIDQRKPIEFLYSHILPSVSSGS